MNDLEREKISRYAKLAKVLKAREREGRSSFTKEESEAMAEMITIRRDLGYAYGDADRTILTLARGMKAGRTLRSSGNAKREPVPGE